MKNTILAAVLACTLVVPNAYTAQQQPGDRFAEADQAFLKRADRDLAFKALKLYESAYLQSPDFDAGWRYAMACYFVAFNLTADREQQKRLYAAGRDAGLAAARLSPGSAEGHFWGAINMALYGQTVGTLKMLFTLGAVREHLLQGVRIDPSYAYGGGCRVLGKIEESLPGLLGGSREEALRYYEQAIASAPDEPLNYYFKAMLQARGFGDKTAARETARKGLALPAPDPSRYESLQALKELQRFAASLQEKK